jgi:hypothetical protein
MFTQFVEGGNLSWIMGEGVARFDVLTAVVSVVQV